jgi:hypothetical protein
MVFIVTTVAYWVRSRPRRTDAVERFIRTLRAETPSSDGEAARLSWVARFGAERRPLAEEIRSLQSAGKNRPC